MTHMTSIDAYTALPRRRVCALGVIMHYPTTPEKQEELSKKVTAVHAQTVMEQIKAMPCPVEQKAELIEAIKRIHQQRDGV